MYWYVNIVHLNCLTLWTRDISYFTEKSILQSYTSLKTSSDFTDSAHSYTCLTDI